MFIPKSIALQVLQVEIYLPIGLRIINLIRVYHLIESAHRATQKRRRFFYRQDGLPDPRFTYDRDQRGDAFIRPLDRLHDLGNLSLINFVSHIPSKNKKAYKQRGRWLFPCMPINTS
jgi:hypothetical protein